jgi:L-glyceraldehyde 3-phosphate reductase
LDYFDIFYSHRYDGVTPVEETMQTLTDMVRQGKALYNCRNKFGATVARQYQRPEKHRFHRRRTSFHQ